MASFTGPALPAAARAAAPSITPVCSVQETKPVRRAIAPAASRSRFFGAQLRAFAGQPQPPSRPPRETATPVRALARTRGKPAAEEEDEIENFFEEEDDDENPTNAPVVGVDIDEDDIEFELMDEEHLLQEHQQYQAEQGWDEEEEYEDDADLLAASSGVEDEELIERIRVNLDKARWYMLQTATNREKHVKSSIEHYINKKKKRDQIFKVLIPKSTYIRTDTGGRQRTMQQKLFPSYVLVQMVMDEEYKTASELIALPNVINFVGQARNVANARRRGKKPVNLPAPLSVADVERIMKLSATVTEEDYQPMHVKVGDAIVAVSGPMQGFNGVVTAISEDRKTVTATMTIFGRENSVDLEAHEVEKDANAPPPAAPAEAAPAPSPSAADAWDAAADQF